MGGRNFGLQPPKINSGGTRIQGNVFNDLNSDGVKEGLEQTKWLPAAEGYDGTLLGFGHYDRGALHGRYLVLRQWRDGTSVEI